MANEETIYMGNALNVNNPSENESKNVFADAWKPVTIGGITGIILGTGAMMATKSYAAIADEETPDGDNRAAETAAGDLAMEKIQAQESLNVATIENGQTFEEAFTAAREQVGPGGVFYWHGVIFSTYTADEWEAMSDEEHAQFAMQVNPEVSADNIDAVTLENLAVEEPADATATAIPEPEMAINEIPQPEPEVAQAEPEVAQAADVEFADVAEVAPEDIAEVAAEELAPVADEDVAIADDQSAETFEDIAMAELPDSPDEDVAFAGFPTKNPAGAMNEPEVEAHIQNIAQDLGSDDDVHIVGYSQTDGHLVTGLDLNGDNMEDIAVIDVDDSGDLSRADIVVDHMGNMSTYGELVDFSQEQMAQEGVNHIDEIHPQNPDVAQDMPDYMDDALAQV